MEYDLVFEGGGAKGMVFAGALQEFESQGFTPGRLLGTSAGAITATLLAAGYNSSEMLEAMAERKSDGKSVFSDFMGDPEPFDEKTICEGAFSRFLDGYDAVLIPEKIEKKLEHSLLKFLANHGISRHLFSFVERGGWYSADNFVKWISAKLDTGTFNGKTRNFSKMTLKQFYEVTGKELSLVASDTSAGMMLVLNFRTSPEVPVVWAVRMSMSIPLVWQEVVWKQEWGKYRDQDMTGHTIVDGGLLSNFPLELFISDSKMVTDLMGQKVSGNVLGFLIDETLQVPGVVKDRSASKLSQLATIQRLSKLVNTMMDARDKSVIASFEKFVVRLPAKNYGTTEFDMSDEKRDKLVSAGQIAMQRYLGQSFSYEPPMSLKEIADKLAERILR